MAAETKYVADAGVSPEMKRIRLIFCITTMFFWASEYCHVPYFTPYLRTLSMSATLIGFLTGTYGFTQLIVRIPLGIFADMSGRYKTLVRSGCFFTTISSLLLYVTTNVPLMFLARVLAGVAASNWVAFTVMYTGYFKPEESGKAIAQLNGYNNGGKLLAFFLGTLAASLWDYKVPLLMSVLTGAAGMIVSIFIKDNQGPGRTPVKFKELLLVFKDTTVLVPALLAIVFQMMGQGTAFSFTSDVARSMSATKVEIGVISCLFTATQIITSMFLMSSFAQKKPSEQLVFAGFGLYTVYCLMVGFAPGVWMLYPAQIVGGFANAVLTSILMSSAIKYVSPQKKSTAMGFYQAIYGIGMTAGPVLMGFFVDHTGYGGGFGIFAAIAAATAVCGLIFLGKINRAHRKA